MNLAVGVSIFSVGLAKKVLIADAIAPLVTPVFTAASLGTPISFFEAWSAITLYPLQLYFDFSGYSDMALGIARMFGIVLPANFNSPFKATNIAEFWQRWHISLTCFLLDYVYEPIAARLTGRVIGWPRDSIRRLLLSSRFRPSHLFLSGLWHGAGWTLLYSAFARGICDPIFSLRRYGDARPQRIHYLRNSRLAFDHDRGHGRLCIF